MKILIVTGMSGSGKTKAMDYLEDIGYYCADNIPPALLHDFIDLLLKSKHTPDKVAICIDIRGVEANAEEDAYEIDNPSYTYKVLFMDANDWVLQSRYKETRRKHPLLEECNGITIDAIAKERKIITPMRSIADYYIDTSELSVADLKEEINHLFLDENEKGMNVMCMSYGTKYGGLNYVDLNFDVRCLPNPFYIPELKHKTGRDKAVYDYVFGNEAAIELRDKMFSLVDYLLPMYEKEGKTQVVIAFSCTGGKHRSVSFAKALYDHLLNSNYDVSVHHRDISKI